MARTVFSSLPYDEPQFVEPGITHKESDYHGGAKVHALEKEHPLRRAKGDLGNRIYDSFEPRASFESGPSPMFILKGRK